MVSPHFSPVIGEGGKLRWKMLDGKILVTEGEKSEGGGGPRAFLGH
jgi:hypothetical protein